jgi:hypothetical protein
MGKKKNPPMVSSEGEGDHITSGSSPTAAKEQAEQSQAGQ